MSITFSFQFTTHIYVGWYADANENVLILPCRLLLNQAYVSIDSLCEKYLTHTIVPVSFNELNTKKFFCTH